MKKTFVFILSMFFTAMFLHGQSGKILSCDVSGLEVGRFYTDAQVRNALGQPSLYETWNNEFGGGREYKYGSNGKYDTFRYEAENGLVEIILTTPKFAFFSNRIRVGDSITKFSQLGSGTLIDNGDNTYFFFPTTITTDMWLVVHTDNNGIIQVLRDSLPN